MSANNALHVAVLGGDGIGPEVMAPALEVLRKIEATSDLKFRFTDAPAGSFLRVAGSQDGDRLPVHYLGDGLLRQPGDVWVDVSAVESVDAPAPGQVPAVDADARQPLPVWVQAHTATRLWSGPDDKAVMLDDGSSESAPSSIQSEVASTIAWCTLFSSSRTLPGQA